MAEDEFEPIAEGPAAAPEVPDTPGAYGGGVPEDPSVDPAAPRAPNSFYLPFWRTKHGKHAFISWQSDNPIAVLALVVIVFLLAAMLLFGLLDAFTPQPVKWVPDVEKALGQGLLTVIGAIVGAAAASSNKRDG